MNLTKRLIWMAKRHFGRLLFAAVGIIGAAALNLVTPEVVRRMTRDMETPGGLTTELLVTFVLVLVFAYLVRAVCRWVTIAISHVAAWNFVGELTIAVYEKLQKLSMGYFHDKQTGQLMSRMINDSRQVEILIAHALPDLVSNLIIILGVSVMIFRIHPMLAALTLIPVPFVIWGGTFFSKKVAPLFRINQEVLGELNAAAQDNLSGLKEIQAFGQEAREMARMNAHRVRYVDVNVRANFANALFHPSIELLTSMGTVVVVGFGGLFAMRGTMSISDVVGFLMYLSLFYQPLAILARLFEDVQTSYAGAVRVFDILDAKSDIVEKEGAAALPRCTGQVSFEHVDFHYIKDEPVLSDISFDIQPGQMVALVGPTGVGKTTIVSLLERFYDPQGGRIALDGHDIRDVTLKSLREQISMVLQDVFLFNGTIAENIAYGVKDATDEQIKAAARVACADDFIVKMPQGYQTKIGERGVRLSGGQKQRLSIARAVLRDTPILVLDEATSAVDTETESRIQQAIENLAGSRTIIVIAHRLSTIMRADQIFVLADGALVERGNYEALSKGNGLFARLSQINI